MTPEERAKNARILYENVNRSTPINRRSFENIVTSAIRAACAERDGQAVEYIMQTGWQFNLTDKEIKGLADALAAHLAQNGGGK